jgi:hypothetical protein
MVFVHALIYLPNFVKAWELTQGETRSVYWFQPFEWLETLRVTALYRCRVKCLKSLNDEMIDGGFRLAAGLWYGQLV